MTSLRGAGGKQYGRDPLTLTTGVILFLSLNKSGPHGRAAQSFEGVALPFRSSPS
jgi:hypothetical protein